MPSTSDVFGRELRCDEEWRDDDSHGNAEQRFQLQWISQLEQNLLNQHEKFKGKDFVRHKDADRFVEHARRFHTLNRYNFIHGLGKFMSFMALGGDIHNYDEFPVVSAAYEGTFRGIVEALFGLQRNVPSHVALRDFLGSFREFLDETDQPKDRQPVMLVKESFRTASIVSSEDPMPEPNTADDVKFRLPPIRIPPRMGVCLDGIHSLIVGECILNCGLDLELFTTEDGRYCEYLDWLNVQGRSRPEDHQSGVKRKHASDWETAGSGEENAAEETVVVPPSAVETNTGGPEAPDVNKVLRSLKRTNLWSKRNPNND